MKINKFIFYFSFSFFLLFFYLWQQIQVVRLGYKIETGKNEIKQLEDENRYLRIRIGELTSLEYIERTAREKLGMKPVNSERVIILPEP